MPFNSIFKLSSEGPDSSNRLRQWWSRLRLIPSLREGLVMLSQLFIFHQFAA